MRRLPAALVTAAAIAGGLAPAAGAKGVAQRLHVCGAHACATLANRAALRSLEPVVMSGGRRRPPGRLAPYVSVSAEPDDALDGAGAFWVPSAGLLQTAGGWVRPKATLRSELDAAARKAVPLSVPPARIEVGTGARRLGPVLLRLLSLPRFRGVLPAGTWSDHWLDISLRFARPAPWDARATGRTGLVDGAQWRWSPRFALLEAADGSFARVPPSLQRALRTTAGLAPAHAAAGGRGGGHGVAAAVVLVAAAGAGAAAVRRRSRTS